MGAARLASGRCGRGAFVLIRAAVRELYATESVELILNDQPPLNAKWLNAQQGHAIHCSPVGGHSQPAATVVAGVPRWRCRECKAEVLDFIIIDSA